MKIFVVQEHIREVEDYGWANITYSDSCTVDKKSFVSFEEAYTYARQKAFEFMQNGWLVNCMETECGIYVDVDALSKIVKTRIEKYSAYYGVCEINVDIPIW